MEQPRGRDLFHLPLLFWIVRRKLRAVEGVLADFSEGVNQCVATSEGCSDRRVHIGPVALVSPQLAHAGAPGPWGPGL